MLRPHLHLGSDQSLPRSTLTPPTMRFPITLLCSISTSPLQVPPHLLPLCPASTSSHHAPPPHLAPGPAPLRTPVGGGAHGCVRGSRGQSLAGSPPVSLETVGGDASYGGEGEEGEKGLSGAARGTPRGSGPGSSRVSSHSGAPASVPLLCFSSFSSVSPGTLPPLGSPQK